MHQLLTIAIMFSHSILKYFSRYFPQTILNITGTFRSNFLTQMFPWSLFFVHARTNYTRVINLPARVAAVCLRSGDLVAVASGCLPEIARPRGSSGWLPSWDRETSFRPRCSSVWLPAEDGETLRFPLNQETPYCTGLDSLQSWVISAKATRWEFSDDLPEFTHSVRFF